MSRWHRDHPDLIGTAADPSMATPGYATALRETEMYERFPDLDARIAHAEHNSTHVCTDPDCGSIQSAATECLACGAPLTEREP